MVFVGAHIMKIATFVSLVSTVGLLAACTQDASVASSGSVPPSAAPTAKAALVANDGAARGEAMITQSADGLRVRVRAAGLTPGAHAVHIHMTGRCTPPDFASAGGHWNPTGRQHGKDNPQGMHMGDMPNMIAGSDGIGEVEYLVSDGVISGGTMPLLDADGAAVVVHAQADDYKSDPAGNAGGRVLCGVVAAG